MEKRTGVRAKGSGGMSTKHNTAKIFILLVNQAIIRHEHNTYLVPKQPVAAGA